MQSDVSLERRCLDQEVAIDRLESEARALRDENADLVAQLADGAVRVEVRDPGSSGTITPRMPDRELGGGFGLHLVEELASRWGVNRTGGTQVWFEVDAIGATHFRQA